MSDENYITGLDYAHMYNLETHAQFVLDMSINAGAKTGQGMWNGKIKGAPVLAYVDFERWIAGCPDPICGGAEMVCFEDEIFFCHSCGNALNNNFAHLVKFPPLEKRERLYAELEKRPLFRPQGQGRVRTAEMSQPAIPFLSRTWHPHESEKDLREQRKRVMHGTYPETDKLPSRKPKLVHLRTDSEKGGRG